MKSKCQISEVNTAAGMNDVALHIDNLMRPAKIFQAAPGLQPEKHHVDRINHNLSRLARTGPIPTRSTLTATPDINIAARAASQKPRSVNDADVLSGTPNSQDSMQPFVFMVPELASSVLGDAGSTTSSEKAAHLERTKHGRKEITEEMRIQPDIRLRIEARFPFVRQKSGANVWWQAPGIDGNEHRICISGHHSQRNEARKLLHGYRKEMMAEDKRRGKRRADFVVR